MLRTTKNIQDEQGLYNRRVNATIQIRYNCFEDHFINRSKSKNNIQPFTNLMNRLI